MRGFVLRFGFLCGKAQEEGEGCGGDGGGGRLVVV